MTEWTKVVTHPLGLAGFALFVVFLMARKSGNRTGAPYFGYIFVLMAVVALVGGIGLAAWQITRSEPPNQRSSPVPAEEKTERVPSPTTQQSTHGLNSPAVAEVEGDVNITITDVEKSGSKK